MWYNRKQFKLKGDEMSYKEDVGDTIKYTLLGLLVVIILTIGITALNGSLYPWWLSIQRKSVEQSKSFTDSNNVALENYMLEYSRLETKIVEAQGNKDFIKAYEAQELAIVTKMCTQISTMNKSTVNPDTISWLNSHGGCR
jgi:hypothetical protein